VILSDTLLIGKINKASTRRGVIKSKDSIDERDVGLTYRWKEAPALGETIEVIPGVYWIRMPLPFALDHINLWVLDDGDGWVLVDTGFNSIDTKNLWVELFNGVFRRYRPKKLVCTHHHPDHMGLADWLINNFNIPMWTTQKEWDAFHRWGGLDRDSLHSLMQNFYRCSGVSIERQQKDYEQRLFQWRRKHVISESLNVLKADDSIIANSKEWTVTIGEGHAPELAALYNAEDKVLISGDQVLPRISPNVSVLPFNLDANPLREFLDSLVRFKELPRNTLVLPSHKLPFTGLHARIDFLIAHHQERLLASEVACEHGASAAEVNTVLFPRALDDQQYFFALSETLAHLNFLWKAGVISRIESESGSYIYTKT